MQQQHLFPGNQDTVSHKTVCFYIKHQNPVRPTETSSVSLQGSSGKKQWEKLINLLMGLSKKWTDIQNIQYKLFPKGTYFNVTSITFDMWLCFEKYETTYIHKSNKLRDVMRLNEIVSKDMLFFESKCLWSRHDHCDTVQRKTLLLAHASYLLLRNLGKSTKQTAAALWTLEARTEKQD